MRYKSTKQKPKTLNPSPMHTVPFLEFAYNHDRYLELAIRNKHQNHHPLIDFLKQMGGKYMH
jgi:hypothetical protein